MTVHYVITLTHPEDTLPPTAEEIRAQVETATGLTATHVTQRTDLDLPYAETGQPPVMVEGAAAGHALSTHLTVAALLVDTEHLFGFMPALAFTFTTDPPLPPIFMPGDERYLRSVATLVTNAAASATKTATTRRRQHGQGPIPQLWAPGR